MHELAEKTRNLNPPPHKDNPDDLPYAILINGIYHSTSPILEAKMYHNLKSHL